MLKLFLLLAGYFFAVASFAVTIPIDLPGQEQAYAPASTGFSGANGARGDISTRMGANGATTTTTTVAPLPSTQPPVPMPPPATPAPSQMSQPQPPAATTNTTIQVTQPPAVPSATVQTTTQPVSPSMPPTQTTTTTVQPMQTAPAAPLPGQQMQQMPAQTTTVVPVQQGTVVTQTPGVAVPVQTTTPLPVVTSGAEYFKNFLANSPNLQVLDTMKQFLAVNNSGPTVSVGPVTLYGLNLNNSGTTIEVSVNQIIPAAVGYVYNCTTCDTPSNQILIGIDNVGAQGCIYNGPANGHGNGYFVLVAPSRPGTYSVRFRPAQAPDCPTALSSWWTNGGAPPVSANIGTIVVK